MDKCRAKPKTKETCNNPAGESGVCWLPSHRRQGHRTIPSKKIKINPEINKKIQEAGSIDYETVVLETSQIPQPPPQHISGWSWLRFALEKVWEEHVRPLWNREVEG